MHRRRLSLQLGCMGAHLSSVLFIKRRFFFYFLFDSLGDKLLREQGWDQLSGRGSKVELRARVGRPQTTS